MGKKKKKYGNPQKQKDYKESLKSKFEKIAVRNGCDLFVPKNGDSVEAKDFMEVVKNSFEFYALDGILYPEGDIIDRKVKPSTAGDMAYIAVKDHRNKASMPKFITVSNSDLEMARSFFIENNSSSWEAFKANLLPSFNGPDKACFVAINFHGGSLGAKFSIPNENLKAVA